MPQVGVAKHHACGRVTINIVGEKYLSHGLHDVGMCCSKLIAEPARGLKIHHPLKAFRTRSGGALSPILWSVLAVPRRRVDQSQSAYTRWIHSRKRLGDTSA